MTTEKIRLALERVVVWDEGEYGWEHEWTNEVMPMVRDALAALDAQSQAEQESRSAE